MDKTHPEASDPYFFAIILMHTCQGAYSSGAKKFSKLANSSNVFDDPVIKILVFTENCFVMNIDLPPVAEL